MLPLDCSLRGFQTHTLASQVFHSYVNNLGLGSCYLCSCTFKPWAPPPPLPRMIFWQDEGFLLGQYSIFASQYLCIRRYSTFEISSLRGGVKQIGEISYLNREHESVNSNAYIEMSPISRRCGWSHCLPAHAGTRLCAYSAKARDPSRYQEGDLTKRFMQTKLRLLRLCRQRNAFVYKITPVAFNKGLVLIHELWFSSAKPHIQKSHVREHKVLLWITSTSYRVDVLMHTKHAINQMSILFLIQMSWS